LDWVPSAQASADTRNYETGVLTILTGLLRHRRFAGRYLPARDWRLAVTCPRPKSSFEKYGASAPPMLILLGQEDGSGSGPGKTMSLALGIWDPEAGAFDVFLFFYIAALVPAFRGGAETSRTTGPRDHFV
jgi:hypothetical protein